jgi:hypothetical protein
MRFLSEERLYSRTEDCLQFLRELGDPPEGASAGPPTRVHLYWYGRFTLKPAFAVKSFLLPRTTKPPSFGCGWIACRATRAGGAIRCCVRCFPSCG